MTPKKSCGTNIIALLYGKFFRANIIRNQLLCTNLDWIIFFLLRSKSYLGLPIPTKTTYVIMAPKWLYPSLRLRIEYLYFVNDKYLMKLQLDTYIPMHTVSFDWFLSGLEWILDLEFVC